MERLNLSRETEFMGFGMDKMTFSIMFIKGILTMTDKSGFEKSIFYC